MSQKERVRLSVMKQVQEEELKLVEASEVMGLSYRQAKRIWRRYQLQGDRGLVHAARGRPSKRAKPAQLRARILARYEKRYGDFGPTLAAEYLAQEGLKVDHETLRRWLLAKGKPRMRRRRQRHRQWRERKPCFGVMVQLDGSHHDWFEGRAPRCVLMVMVDDATNRVWAQFFEEETTRASYDMLEAWVRRWGLPQSLYVDKDSIYRCEGLGSIAEQMAGKGPQTQFGRAMGQLGVELILANSPQAKGRVERMNGTLQDRLVKALRLEGITDMEAANEFLAKKFLPAFNRKFEVQPASQADAHRGIPRELDQVLSWEEQRVVQKDWTVVCQNQWYQLDREHEPLGLAGKKIIVRTLRNGTVQLDKGGVKLRSRRLSGRPQRLVKQREQVQVVKAPAKPIGEHPWRQPFIGGRRRANRAAAMLGMGASGQPPLRSGFPPAPIPSRGRLTTTTKREGDIFA
jgi:molybdenum-dependent DNA-binding transcriptional regulator ModE